MTHVLRLPVLTANDQPKEKCGVFGVWGGSDWTDTATPSAATLLANGNQVHPHHGSAPAVLAYLATYAQQHRGQESAGIAVSTGSDIVAHNGMGLVAEVFNSRSLELLNRAGGQGGGRGAIAHNRYSTAGGSLACNVQPIVQRYIGGQIAVAHNGNLINADLYRRRFEEAGHIFHTTSDTEVIVHLLASPEQQQAVDPLAATLRRLEGAFSLVFLYHDRIEACRDPWGWRPLTLGRLADGRYCVASETVALDVIGADIIRDIEPGEIVTIDDHGIRSRRFADPAERPAQCVFEHVYFANPSSRVFGDNVQVAREKMGEVLAREAPVDADYVMPMPDSGRSAATGYARASGIEYREGIVPNRYVGRTFIKPTQAERSAAVRLKLNVIREIVDGKRLIVVDDSIVRGTTTQVKMNQLRAAGAREIHLRISCPPIRHPCFFGVDFASRDQLIANKRTVEEIRAYLGVDSLHYLSLDGMLSCVSHPAETYCTACYTGDYRLDVEHPITDEVTGSQLRMF